MWLPSSLALFPSLLFLSILEQFILKVVRWVPAGEKQQQGEIQEGCWSPHGIRRVSAWGGGAQCGREGDQISCK